MRSPGLLARHYSPVTPLMLFSGNRETALAQLKQTALERCARGDAVVVLAFDEDRPELATVGLRTIPLGPEHDPPVVGARLYAALREADAARADVILARGLASDHPLSAAIQDRLRRAAAI